jgi:hypothetical protein
LRPPSEIIIPCSLSDNIASESIRSSYFPGAITPKPITSCSLSEIIIPR